MVALTFWWRILMILWIYCSISSPICVVYINVTDGGIWSPFWISTKYMGQGLTDSGEEQALDNEFYTSTPWLIYRICSSLMISWNCLHLKRVEPEILYRTILPIPRYSQLGKLQSCSSLLLRTSEENHKLVGPSEHNSISKTNCTKQHVQKKISTSNLLYKYEEQESYKYHLRLKNVKTDKQNQ